MSDDVCWIDIIDEDEATGILKSAYESLRKRDGYTQNLYRAFSRYPYAMLSADQAYRDVIHVPDAPLPMWLSELMGIQVAVISECQYAITHHADNLSRLHKSTEVALRMLDALKDRDWHNEIFEPKVRSMLVFGEKLTCRPEAMQRADIEDSRSAGLSDEGISQTVQVVANFSYWVRVVNAFGIRSGNERIGRYV